MLSGPVFVAAGEGLSCGCAAASPTCGYAAALVEQGSASSPPNKMGSDRD